MTNTPEMIDICDESGNPLGSALPRPVVHREGHWHKTVHVWLWNSGGQILVQKRSANKGSYPSRWDVSSAGHISAGDSPPNAATREVFEELGIMLHSRELVHLGERKQSAVFPERQYRDNEIAIIFAARYDGDIASLQLQETEVSAAAWLSPEELLSGGSTEDFVPHGSEYLLIREYVGKMTASVE